MYGQAGRPVLRVITKQAETMNLAGTASQETLRRVLKGLSVPERWETMYAVYAPLCELAGVDPDAPYRWAVQYQVEGEGGPEYEVVTWKHPSAHKDVLRTLWNAAIDGDPSFDVMNRTKVERRKPRQSFPESNLDPSAPGT